MLVVTQAVLRASRAFIDAALLGLEMEMRPATLASLMSKPFQRLMRYPMLLGALLDSLPASDAKAAAAVRDGLAQATQQVQEGSDPP